MPQSAQEDDYLSESDIECPRCGEVFYYELARCPNCGLSVYEPEEDEFEGEAETGWETAQGRDAFDDWLAKLTPAAAIFAGLFFSFVISTVVFIVLRSFFGDLALDGPGRAVPLFGVLAGAGVGGYAAAALEGKQPRRMGWWVGALSIIAVVVLSGVDTDAAGGGWLRVETLPVWIMTVLCGAAGGEFFRRRQRDVVVDQLFLDYPPEDKLYAGLMAMTGHDAERVERLIEHERYFMPNATRRTLIESAINRLERDRR